MLYYCTRMITLTGHVAELFSDGISCCRHFNFLTGTTSRYSPVDILAGTESLLSCGHRNRHYQSLLSCGCLNQSSQSLLLWTLIGSVNRYRTVDILIDTIPFHRIVSSTFFCAATDLFQKSRVE